MIVKRNHRVFAADEAYDDLMYDEETGLDDTLEDMQDTLEDMQDQVEDIEEDEVDIEVDNNIENHYIAECNKCKGIFISAVVESDQDISNIHGICPLCDKESDQELKWIIRETKDVVTDDTEL